MNRTRSKGRATGCAVVLALLAVGGLACSGSKSAGAGPVVATGFGAHGGSSGSGGGSGGGDGFELTQAAIDFQGGSSTSSGGQGKDGGDVHILASGDVTIDPSVGPAAAPAVPGAPGDATGLASDGLGADVTAGGSIVVSGDATAGGSDPVRTITTTGGDIFISGKLRGADLGGARQGIHLVANGTVYVTGTVDTSGEAGTGQAGGGIQISAQQIVVTGKLLAGGGQGNEAGGAGGALSLVATGGIFFDGAADSLGGDGRGSGAVTGGAAGAVTFQAGGDVTIGGKLRMRGGGAASKDGDAQGGAGAALAVDSNGNVQMGGIIDGRGGPAAASLTGGTVAGGAAGSFKLGASAPPTQAVIAAPVLAFGGDGEAVAGNGGTVLLEPDTGTLTLAGSPAVDAGGGASKNKGGTGGNITGSPRRDPGTGGVHVSGLVSANGGAVVDGGSGSGGDAGRVMFQLTPTGGAFTLDASGKMTAEGGPSRGASVAGGGGHIWVWTKDGDLTLAGTVSTRGGAAADPGGQGGGGGMIYCFSDANHNAIYNNFGNLLIAPTGVLDSSGGDGSTGGNGRNNGGPSVATFPENQEQIAIFLNCDGAHGETHNWMDNQGHLIARGGAHNGNGGDIVYHGIGPGQYGSPLASGQSQHHPPSGNVDMSPDGSGTKGDFLGE